MNAWYLKKLSEKDKEEALRQEKELSLNKERGRALNRVVKELQDFVKTRFDGFPEVSWNIELNRAAIYWEDNLVPLFYITSNIVANPSCADAEKYGEYWPGPTDYVEINLYDSNMNLLGNTTEKIDDEIFGMLMLLNQKD